jgi:hypothetical protein
MKIKGCKAQITTDPVETKRVCVPRRVYHCGFGLIVPAPSSLTRLCMDEPELVSITQQLNSIILLACLL